jgi:sugar fermentation stimulation protein A
MGVIGSWHPKCVAVFFVEKRSIQRPPAARAGLASSLLEIEYLITSLVHTVAGFFYCPLTATFSNSVSMQFPSPLVRGRLIKRYKRFLADVLLDDGQTVTASCANTGSMLGLAHEGVPVWLSETDSPTRKYRHTWELVENDMGAGPVLVGINTGHPNKIVAEAIEAKRIRKLTGYETLRREVKYGQSSRVDIRLEDPKKGLAYVEVKNVHLSRKKARAEFPDSVTARGAKHLRELADMAEAGHRAVMLFLIQRPDATSFSLAEDIDPAYAEAFRDATSRGVETLAYRCTIDPNQISLDKSVRLVV